MNLPDALVFTQRMGACDAGPLGHASLLNTLNSLRSTVATRDVHLPHRCANYQVVQKFFSSWNHCSFVRRAPKNLMVSG